MCLLNQHAESRTVGRIEPHGQRIYELSNERFVVGMISPGNRDADREICWSAVRGKHHMKRREQHHVHGRAHVTTELLQLINKNRRYYKRLPGASVRHVRRTGTIGRQMQRWQFPEFVTPV